jgi:phosphomannomutase
MLETLQALRKRAVVGFVGGSDLIKITEQLTKDGGPGLSQPSSCVINNNMITNIESIVINDYDYAFAEGGLTAFKLGQPLPSASFIKFLGEDKWKAMVKFVLHYIADLDLPYKR